MDGFNLANATSRCSNLSSIMASKLCYTTIPNKLWMIGFVRIVIEFRAMSKV